MVTEFILTDVENDEPIIPSDTFFRIAQFLEPNSGLLPSLSHLRIIQADNYFPYLHLLHTSSLKTLEANVPDHHQPSFFSFLTTLVYKAPFLEEIILGPGQFPLKSLQATLKFTHLHKLELRDVTSTIDFTFLQDVGTLSDLESFILDARSCKYTARTVPEEQPSSETPPAEHAEARNQSPQPSFDIDGAGSTTSYEDTTEDSSIKPKSSNIDGDESSQIVCPSESSPASPMVGINEDIEVDQPLPPIFDQDSSNKDSSISAVGGFYQLKKFHFVGGLPLLQDMILYIASSTLEDISITVNQQDPELEAEDKREAAERRRDFDQKTELEILAIPVERPTKFKSSLFGSPSPGGRSSKQQAIRSEAETRWKEQEAQYEERKKAERLEKHITILQTVSSRWSADLKTVKFNNLDGSSQPLPTLLATVYGPLFCHPKLEILEFKQWKIDPVENFLSSLKSSRPQKLKQLHLPAEDPDGSAIPLSGLLDIAEACPMLEYLHCCIDTLSPIPEYPIPATTKVLSHGLLQSLFVANNPTPTSLWDFNRLLLVARHLYLTFPNLQTIDNVEGPNAEQWVRIRDLVKMCQVIRMDDVYRFV